VHFDLDAGRFATWCKHDLGRAEYRAQFLCRSDPLE
jgi:hypothetical protein